MTGRENVVFAARIHGLWGSEIQELVRRVEEFSELGEFFDMEVSTYSSGMRARLSFSIAMLFEFDCYFIDELNAVGDARFRRLTREYFERTRRTATFIQVSHDLNDLHKICDAGILVNDGMATYYEYVDDAIAAYRAIVGEAGDFEDMEEAAGEAPPAVETVALVAPQTRQARRAAALARKRQRQRARRLQAAEAPAAGGMQAAATPGEERAPRRHRNRRRIGEPAAAAVAPPPAPRRRRAKRKPKVVAQGLSPSQILALQDKARRKGKSRRSTGGPADS
jgi:capsular polysaccharide transport system ATP-binding protein